MATQANMAILAVLSPLIILLSGCDDKGTEREEQAYPQFDSIIVIYQGVSDSNALNELVIINPAIFSGVPRIERTALESANQDCDSSQGKLCIHIQFPRRTPGWNARIIGDPQKVSESFGDISSWLNDCGPYQVDAYFRDQYRYDLMSQQELDLKIQHIGLDSNSARLYEAFIDSTASYTKENPFYCM